MLHLLWQGYYIIMFLKDLSFVLSFHPGYQPAYCILILIQNSFYKALFSYIASFSPLLHSFHLWLFIRRTHRALVPCILFAYYTLDMSCKTTLDYNVILIIYQTICTEDSWNGFSIRFNAKSFPWQYIQRRQTKVQVHTQSAFFFFCFFFNWRHCERPWCWEGLGAGGERDDRGWDGWMASPTRWAWVWVNSGSWWWTGRPGVLQFMGLQSWTQLSDWTELNWTELLYNILVFFFFFSVLHWNESAMGVHVSPILKLHSYLPPHPIPQGWPSTPCLNALFYASKLYWWSISDKVIYMFECYSFK